MTLIIFQVYFRNFVIFYVLNDFVAKGQLCLRMKSHIKLEKHASGEIHNNVRLSLLMLGLGLPCLFS